MGLNVEPTWGLNVEPKWGLNMETCNEGGHKAEVTQESRRTRWLRATRMWGQHVAFAILWLVLSPFEVAAVVPEASDRVLMSCHVSLSLSCSEGPLPRQGAAFSDALYAAT